MAWQFNSLVPLMFGATAISIVVAAFTLRRRSARGSVSLAAINLSGALWALTAGLQLASGTLAFKIIFHKLSFVAMDGIGLTLFAFAASYSGRTRWIRGPRLAVLSLPFVVTQVLVWTSGHQTLMWKALSLGSYDSLKVLHETPGTWWWVDFVCTYLLVVAAIGLLGFMFIRSPGLYRRQVTAVLAAVFVPLAADLLYVYRFEAADSINLTPALFTWVGLALYWGFTRYRLLDVSPAAREYIVGHMSDSVVVADAKDRVVYLNPSAEQLTGRDLRFAAGKAIIEVMEDCPGLLSTDLTKTGPVENLQEYEHAGRFYEGRASTLCDRRGRLRGTILAFRDTTDRRTAELALQEARRDLELRVQEATAELRTANIELFEGRTRLAHLLSSSPAVIYCREPAEPFPVTFVGDNLESQLGYKAAQVLGSADLWRERIHPEDRHLLADMAEVLTQGEASYEYRIVSEDQSFRWIHDRIRVVRDLNGKPSELIGSWLDVTDRRTMEDQLRQSSKMEAVGVLAGGIAHDFNNLLTAMGGYAELTMMALGEEHPVRHNVVEISRAVNRAGSLTRQLLAFSRRQVLKPQIMSLNDVVRSTEEMFGRLIGEHIEFGTELAPDLGLVRADPGQMEQVCMNLVINARDAMPQGGRLIVRTENMDFAKRGVGIFADVAPGSYVALSVTDTGHGIAQDVLPRVFEPFFTTKADGGTGLGLATVYGIAGQSGGRVAVESAIGVGTTFWILLPRLQAGVERDTVHAPTPAKHKKAGSETVLVVEDEASVRSLVAAALHRHGFGVQEADGAETALELVDRHGPPDLLVTDVVMKYASGPDLVRRLHKSYPELRVLYMSGYARDDLEKALTDHDAKLLMKPFTMDSLVAAVSAALSGARR
jgi:PAS domain S-box-containing protein